MNHTQVRITYVYLEKLRELAKKQNRPMSRQLEVLIDRANKELSE